MPTKLDIWNLALNALGHENISDTGEPNKAAKAFVLSFDNVLDQCLAEETWAFAVETETLTPDTGAPNFGYAYTFAKPSGWVEIEALARDSRFIDPLLAYYEDEDHFAADTGQIFIRYVSGDTGAGRDFERWPAAFTRYVTLELAYQNCIKITGSYELWERIGKDRDDAKARAIDADVFRPPWPTLDPAERSRRAIIHQALIELGELGKVSVGNEDPRRVLAYLYDTVVAECLAAGSWNFAIETVKLEADTGVTPAFGFTQVFAKPDDWVRTVGVSQDEYFSYPLLHYYDDQGFWSADNSPIYVRYVSNDTGLGLELNRWTQNFIRYVVLELALRGCHVIVQHVMSRSLTENQGRTIDLARVTNVAQVTAQRLEDQRNKAKKLALNVDSMNEPQPRFAPPSSWTQARAGRIGRGDRGNRGRLIG